MEEVLENFEEGEVWVYASDNGVFSAARGCNTRWGREPRTGFRTQGILHFVVEAEILSLLAGSSLLFLGPSGWPFFS